MKKLKIIPILFATAFLAGCNNINPSSSSISSPSSNSSSATSGTTASSNATSNSTTDSATSTSSSSSPSSISSSSTSSSTPTIEEGVSKYSHFQSISNKSRQAGFLPSLGNPNILVIPVDFSDYTFVEAGAKSNEAARERIEDAYFGERNDDELHESLRSYYKKSSYGQLDITGVVTPVIRAPRTYAYYKSITNSSTQTDLIDGIIRLALKTLDSTYDYHDFDTNGDNIIDAIWLVYSGPIDNGGNSMFWAFTYWSYMEDQFDGVDVSPYAWAAYKFFDEGGYTDHPDAHTTIHETGHLMGLDDYYDYDGYRTPAGGLDMMDNNIGDHMAFNKYNLGWVKPETITESGTYTLKPFQENGQFLLLNMNWNKTYYDKYLLLEYYTPTGLNRFDTENTDNKYLHGFTENGVKAYLVDSRVGAIIQNGMSSTGTWNNNFYYDFDESSFTISITYDLIYSNTPSRSYDRKVTTWNPHPLIRLLEATGNNRFVVPGHQQTADNSTLFQEGDSISSSLNMYNDETLGFNISFGKCTDEGVTITITK